MDPITALRHLREAGFAGTRQFGMAGELTTLIYCRWWTGDHTDVVVVRTAHEAEVLRVVGFNPQRPHELDRARIIWRDRGPVPDMVTAVLDLSAPSPEIPLRLRTAQASRSAEHVAALGNC